MASGNKKATERIKRIVAEVLENDQKPKAPRTPRPALKVKSAGKPTPPFRYPGSPQRTRVADLRCCVVKHGDDLPTYFVRCRDCPLDTGPDA